MRRANFFTLLTAFAVTAGFQAAAQTADPQTILAENCAGCHGADVQKSELRLDSLNAAQKGGKSGKPAIVPGDVTASEVARRIVLPGGAPDNMPPDGKEPLTPEETLAVLQWIAAGAEWSGAEPAPEPQPEATPALAEGEVDFSKAVMPIFHARCIECHGPESQKSGLRLDTREAVLNGADLGPVIVAGKPDESRLVQLISLPVDHADLMPPKGDPLTEEEIATIRRWVKEGAKPGSAPYVAEAPKEEKKDLLAVLAESVSPADPAALDTVRNAGALAMPIDQKSPLVRADFHLQGDEIGDDALAALEGIKEQLTWLNLANTAVTDAGLAKLGDFKNLTMVHLENTEIGDEGLEHLKGLENLQYLNLYGTNVSDQGLKHLSGLANLESVYLWQSNTTQEGAAMLAKAIPGVDVNLGSELTIIEPEEETPAEEADAEKPAEEKEAKADLATFFDDGGCCAKAHADGNACEHPCCAEAAKAGKVCEKCNPKGAEAQASAKKA